MDMDAVVAQIGKLEAQVAFLESHFNESFWNALDVAYQATLPKRTLTCIVCGHQQSWHEWEKLIDRCMFGGGHLERYRCPQCDCIFGPMKYLDLDEAFVMRDYKLLYSRYKESDSTETEIRTFRSMHPEPGKLYLDWGCGGVWSRTVERLRSEKYDVWGYEPSAETTANFVVRTREEVSARFSGIFSNNVIEHFRDPIAQFTDFRAILVDHGIMAHSSPCYEYNCAHTRFHTLFLTGRAPHVLAEKTGFLVKQLIKDGEYINAVFERK